MHPILASAPLVVATPLVADGQVTKRTLCADSPVVTKAIAHRLTEFPLSIQKRIVLVLAVTPLVTAIAQLVVAITHIASLLLHSLRVLRGHQLSSGLTNRPTNHTADQ
jgi:hypothetical protein